jgi:hypothetical protein
LRHEKASFDDIEPPVVVTTPIDGMTDEQWAWRNERDGRRVALVFGLLAWITTIALEWLWWSGVIRFPGVHVFNMWALTALSFVAFVVAFMLAVVLLRWR